MTHTPEHIKALEEAAFVWEQRFYALQAQNRDLLAALEEAGHTSTCSNDSELTPTAKDGRGLCERCAAIAQAKEAK